MNEQTKASRGVTGRVISNKMDKTITVLIERRLPHPVYRKYVRSSSKLHAHDENNECKEGDTVLIEQSRPLSRTKSWRLVKVVGRAE
ncbi:MAG: 30S ribosomal protein S17 [Gammaproteobacteria bacterium]